METQTEVLDFVKAMASVERLRVIGALVRGRATRAQIADQLHIPVRDAFQHLAFLMHAGVVHEEDDLFELDEKAIEALARGQFENKGPQYEEQPEDVRKVLKAYFSSDGMLKQIPTDKKKLLVILNFIVDVFDVGGTYTEKEVNTILRRFNPDTAALRRYLVDHGFLAREGDGSKYWRVKNG